jgi:hypothetical protein
MGMALILKINMTGSGSLGCASVFNEWEVN